MKKQESNWAEHKALLDWLEDLQSLDGSGECLSGLGLFRRWLKRKDITHEWKELVALAFSKAKWHPESTYWSTRQCGLCRLRDSSVPEKTCADCIIGVETGITTIDGPPNLRIISNLCREIIHAFNLKDGKDGETRTKKIKQAQRKAYRLLSDLYRVKYNAYFGTAY
jgi:hypothetical protein